MLDYNMKPFRFWCQKVLPLVYDDSLSYMELLGKVINYLNHVIEDVNGIPEYIQSLISEEVLKDILTSLLDELKEQIVPVNEGTRTTASADREQGDLIWLNGKLAVITRDILAGTEYVEKTDEIGITGNFKYTNIEKETRPSYNSDTQVLTIHGLVDSHTQIISKGDTHIFDGATETMNIVEVK